MKMINNTGPLLLGIGMFCCSIGHLTADDKTTKSQMEKELDDGAPELTEKTTEAIMRGFEFLLTIQQADGSWRSDSKGMHAQQVPEGDTALVLLAFMVKGYFPGYDIYGDALDRGKKYLLDAAKKSPDGYLGHSMYEHALATLAFSEMLGMTKKREDDEEIYAALEAAIKVILRAQDPRGSWTYTPMPNGGDTSISIMQLVALASARQAGIVVPDETIDRGVAYLKSCQSKETGAFAYSPGNTRNSIPCSAAAAYVLHLCGQRDSEMLEAGMDYLRSLPDDIFKTKNYYYYMHYYAMQAMVQDSDDSYAVWYPKVRDSMLERQDKGTAKKGGKPSGGSWTGGAGGRAQSTAMSILTLGTPYRFLPIYQR
ncbi:MAG: terpene cyclase/mutase family protein [Akkermansiaceae bacterium]